MKKHFTQKRLSIRKSEKRILFIKPIQLKRYSRYGSFLIVSFIGYNNDCILVIIGLISDSDMVIYVFVVPMKKCVPDFY